MSSDPGCCLTVRDAKRYLSQPTWRCGARGNEIEIRTRASLGPLRRSGISARGEAAPARHRQPGVGAVVRFDRTAAGGGSTRGGAPGGRRPHRRPRRKGGSEPRRVGVRRERSGAGGVGRAESPHAATAGGELGSSDPDRQGGRRHADPRGRRDGNEVVDAPAVNVGQGAGRRVDAGVHPGDAAVFGIRSGGRSRSRGADRYCGRAGAALQRGQGGGAGAAGHPGLCLTRSEKFVDEPLPERRDASAERAPRRAPQRVEAARSHPPRGSPRCAG